MENGVPQRSACTNEPARFKLLKQTEEETIDVRLKSQSLFVPDGIGVGGSAELQIRSKPTTQGTIANVIPIPTASPITSTYARSMKKAATAGTAIPTITSTLTTATTPWPVW
jgi:hypothetical protein